GPELRLLQPIPGAGGPPGRRPGRGRRESELHGLGRGEACLPLSQDSLPPRGGGSGWGAARSQSARSLAYFVTAMPRPRSDDTVDQIKSRLNLVEVVQQYVPLRKRGRELWGICPFHPEKTPSFKVNEQQQSWHCFGCDKGGDLFSFIEQMEQVDFRRALELLADRAGVELPDRSPADRQRSDARRRVVELNKLAAQYYEYVLHSTSAGAPGRDFLARRQVDAETARHFTLGY